MMLNKKTELSSDDGKVIFQEGSGLYSIVLPDFELRDCAPALYLDGKKVSLGSWILTASTKKSLTAKADGKAGSFEFKISIARNGGFTFALKGRLQESSPDIELLYFDNLSQAADLVLPQDAGELESTTGAIPLVKGTKQSFSGGFQLLVSRNGKQLQLSYPVLCNHIPCFHGQAVSGKIMGCKAGSSIKHYSSRTLALAPLTVRSGDGFRLIADYADANAADKDFSEAFAPGWNSWDYYRWTVTEDEVLENAEFIASDPVLSKHVKRIIVDDGWQYAYGEWEANSLFPHGMEYLADRLTKLGFEPGLWIAPLICEPHSRIAQLDADMLGLAENGLPALAYACMERHGFVLDPTVEKTRQYIEKLIEKYTIRGFRYFKLDFLNFVMQVRQFHDQSVPRGKLIDLVIAAARKGAAGQARILGCGYQYCAGGVVDAARIGGDIHARWESIRCNTPSVAARYWANRKLWINDPDFALCRSFDTSDDPDLNRLQPCLVGIRPEDTDPNTPAALFRQVDIRRPQVEILLGLVIVAGGAVNLSDKMTRLNSAGLDMARRTVSAEPGETGIPLDLFESALPKYWVQKTVRGFRVLLINWEDTPAELSLDLVKLGIAGGRAVDFWYDTPITIKSGRLTASLAPRSCLFAVVNP